MLRSGLDLARVLLERHQHENLAFRHEEMRNQDGKRLVYGDLHTAGRWLEEEYGVDRTDCLVALAPNNVEMQRELGLDVPLICGWRRDHHPPRSLGARHTLFVLTLGQS